MDHASGVRRGWRDHHGACALTVISGVFQWLRLVSFSNFQEGRRMLHWPPAGNPMDDAEQVPA